MNSKILLIWIVVFLTFGFIQAQPERKTMQFGGFEREYLVYTPNNSQHNKASGMIVCLHGFGRTMSDFFEGYNISHVADSLNLIIAAPQAIEEKDPLVKLQADLINSITNERISLNSVWGCGLSIKVSLLGMQLLNEELNKDVDDVGFINKIIDNVLDEFSLTSHNVFILGTSMGGYMSYQYALINGERLSGLLSIAGSMGLAVKGMDYNIKIPICDFHSVTDEVVPYTGSMTQYLGLVSLAKDKKEVLDYWSKTNETGNPVTEQVQNYVSTNDITVEKIIYPNPVNEVIHYKANGASHGYFFRKENGDCMDFIEEISKFIESHLSDSHTAIPDVIADKVSFYPNPVRDNIYLDTKNCEVSIFEITGRKIYYQQLSAGQVDLSFLKPGIYIISIKSGDTLKFNKLIKQ